MMVDTWRPKKDVTNNPIYRDRKPTSESTNMYGSTYKVCTAYEYERVFRDLPCVMHPQRNYRSRKPLSRDLVPVSEAEFSLPRTF
jgi:hypothetical protein